MAVASLAMSMPAPSAAGASGVAHTPARLVGPPISGTITWTSTTERSSDLSDEYGFGDTLRSTVTASATMRLELRRDGRFVGRFTVVDTMSQYESDYSERSVTQARLTSGEVQCSATATVQAGAAGRFAKPGDANDTRPAVLSASVVPGDVARIGPRTKGIIVQPVFMNRGSTTSSYAGMDPGCPDGRQVTSDFETVTIPAVTDEGVCYPQGRTARLRGATSGSLVGVWRPARRSFVFDCTNVTVSDGETVTLTVTGSLQYR